MGCLVSGVGVCVRVGPGVLGSEVGKVGESE